jgi:hypothetical protein
VSLGQRKEPRLKRPLLWLLLGAVLIGGCYVYPSHVEQRSDYSTESGPNVSRPGGLARGGDDAERTQDVAERPVAVPRMAAGVREGLAGPFGAPPADTRGQADSLEANVDARVRALAVAEPQIGSVVEVPADGVLQLLAVWPPEERARAACIAFWESRWQWWAVNEEGCAGLWQLCRRWHEWRLEPYGGWERVLNPEVNARVAHSIWSDWGGTWGAWAETEWRCR